MYENASQCSEGSGKLEGMHESGRGNENRHNELTTMAVSREEGVHGEGIRAETV
jgi:hypothetical protein